MIIIVDKKDEYIPKTKFNIGLKILEILGVRIEKAVSRYEQGNLSGWFFELKAIKMLMIAKIGQTRKLDLKRREKIIANYILNIKKDPHKYKQLLSDAIEEYNEQIQYILEESGVSIPSREARHLLFGQNKEKILVNPEEEFTGM